MLFSLLTTALTQQTQTRALDFATFKQDFDGEYQFETYHNCDMAQKEQTPSHWTYCAEGTILVNVTQQGPRTAKVEYSIGTYANTIVVDPDNNFSVRCQPGIFVTSTVTGDFRHDLVNDVGEAVESVTSSPKGSDPDFPNDHALIVKFSHVSFPRRVLSEGSCQAQFVRLESSNRPTATGTGTDSTMISRQTERPLQNTERPSAKTPRATATPQSSGLGALPSLFLFFLAL